MINLFDQIITSLNFPLGTAIFGKVSTVDIVHTFPIPKIMSESSKKVPLSGSERQRKYKENNKLKVELNELKQSIARSKLKETDPDKAQKVKENNRKRKAEQRRRQKELTTSETSESDNTTPCDDFSMRRRRFVSGDSSVVTLANDDGTFAKPSPSRQYLEGVKQRKRNRKESEIRMKDIIEENDNLKRDQDKVDDTIFDLELKIADLENQLESSKHKIVELETENSKSYDWFGTLYENMSARGRREIRDVFFVIKPQLEKGTLHKLRKNMGINFSIPTANVSQENSELKNKVLDFCKYWPAQFVKPCPSEFGTCLCITCQNMELKVLALQNRKLIHNFYKLEDIVFDSRNGNFDTENYFKKDVESLALEEHKHIDIAFQQWEKVKQTEVNKNTGKVKGDKIMRLAKHLTAIELGKDILEEFENYKNHLERDFVMKQELKYVRLEALENADVAVLHVDWAEQHKLTEVKEIQSAYFNGRYSYDIHTGYCYTKDDSHGFASLSDSSDHRAEAIHCALKPKIVQLVGKGFRKIVICSDSPVSQYRNAKNIFLMKILAQELQVSIRLLFTEAGHGKSPCDGVGGNIKTQVESAMLAMFGDKETNSIHSVQDVKKVIEEKTNLTYEISTHTKEDIENVKKVMPKLSALVGALKVHEVYIHADGKMMKKDLPTDSFYKQVVIRQSRRKNINELPHDIEPNEAFIDNSNIPTEVRRSTRRIMTNAEIAAELDASSSDED